MTNIHKYFRVGFSIFFVWWFCWPSLLFAQATGGGSGRASWLYSDLLVNYTSESGGAAPVNIAGYELAVAPVIYYPLTLDLYFQQNTYNKVLSDQNDRVVRYRETAYGTGLRFYFFDSFFLRAFYGPLAIKNSDGVYTTHRQLGVGLGAMISLASSVNFTFVLGKISFLDNSSLSRFYFGFGLTGYF
jgi:hypothetical protein